MGVLLPVIDFLARRAFLGAGLRSLTLTLPSSGSTTNTIHYWPPPGEPRLPSLLLVHGFGPMATWQWRRQVGPLSRHFHVIAPDLLCFGASSCDCNPAPSEAAALAALLDAVAAGARVAVAGTSYGGFVAYALAAADDGALLDRAGGGFARTADLLVPLDARGARRLMELSFYRRQAMSVLPDFVIRGAVRQLFTDKREEKIELMRAITIGTDDFQLTPLPQLYDACNGWKCCLSGETTIRYFPWKRHLPSRD